jgi:hypothetical protein
MTNDELGITKKCDLMQQIIDIRNSVIKHMYNSGYTITEISSVVRLNKAGISRVIRFGSNSNRKVVKNIIN